MAGSRLHFVSGPDLYVTEGDAEAAARLWTARDVPQVPHTGYATLTDVNTGAVHVNPNAVMYVTAQLDFDASAFGVDAI